MKNIQRFPNPVLWVLLISCGFFFLSCKSDRKNNNISEGIAPKEEKSSSEQILFSADSAYSFIEKQLSFGPRVPNTPEHAACAEWLVSKLRDFGAEVYTQKAEVKTHHGDLLPITNIVASYHPEKDQRILLLAHWDTRPKAENDPSPARQKEPILGADDGGSGVAVLLEIARQLQLQKSTLPVDILLVDAEDSGESNVEDSWCLGSTYWSLNPYPQGYKARYGILLDMVGSKDAVFRWEFFSKRHAPGLVSMIWETARQCGYGRYFIQADGTALTDDHIPIINNLGIPTVDVVNYSPDRTYGFGDHWHTHTDNISIIDKKVLEAVGNTVWQVINNY